MSCVIKLDVRQCKCGNCPCVCATCEARAGADQQRRRQAVHRHALRTSSRTRRRRKDRPCLCFEDGNALKLDAGALESEQPGAVCPPHVWQPGVRLHGRALLDARRGRVFQRRKAHLLSGSRTRSLSARKEYDDVEPHAR